MFSFNTYYVSISHQFLGLPKDIQQLSGNTDMVVGPGYWRLKVQKLEALESPLFQSQAMAPLQSWLGSLQTQTAESHYYCVLGFL